jgi:cephalosporin hydroxylase
MQRLEDVLDGPVSAIVDEIDERLRDPSTSWGLGATQSKPDGWLLAYMLRTMRLLREHRNVSVRTFVAALQTEIMKGAGTYDLAIVIKAAFDLWVYREIIRELRPDVIVEVGIWEGGHTMWLADTLAEAGGGKVVGVDVTLSRVLGAVKVHPRITLMEADATSAAPSVAELCRTASCVLVIEDSLHTYDNTLAVLRAYAPIVTPGSLLICEDTNCYHGLEAGFSPGPWEAVHTFLGESEDFKSERSLEKFCVTWNPTGFLRKRFNALPMAIASQ